MRHATGGRRLDPKLQHGAGLGLSPLRPFRGAKGVQGDRLGPPEPVANPSGVPPEGEEHPILFPGLRVYDLRILAASPQGPRLTGKTGARRLAAAALSAGRRAPVQETPPPSGGRAFYRLRSLLESPTSLMQSVSTYWQDWVSRQVRGEKPRESRRLGRSYSALSSSRRAMLRRSPPGESSVVQSGANSLIEQLGRNERELRAFNRATFGVDPSEADHPRGRVAPGQLLPDRGADPDGAAPPAAGLQPGAAPARRGPLRRPSPGL